MDYDAYHDESQVDGYWHGIALVPFVSRDQIVQHLIEARDTTGYYDPISLKRIRSYGKKYDCAKAWLSIAIASMRSRPKGAPVPIYLGRSSQRAPVYRLLRQPLGVKFILFCERDTLRLMTSHPDHASKVETTLRMAFKGGIHFLGSDDEPISIQHIHLDGHEHHHRNVDRSRLVDRIAGLREYCHIASSPDLIDDASADHRRSDSQSYEDCQLSQLTDLLVGGFRNAIRGTVKSGLKPLAYPVKSLLIRYAQGPARMANSRWHNSFCMSQAYLESGSWHFGPLECSPTPDAIQTSLFYV